MADDRPELHETAADWDDDRDPTPEEQAEEDAWIAVNFDEIKAKIDETLNDPRPAVPIDEAFARVHAHINRLYADKDGDA